MFAKLNQAGKSWGSLRAGRKLRLEHMEERRLMAADIYYSSALEMLYIEGTGDGDKIVVESWSSNQVRATVYDKSGSVLKDASGNELREFFNRDQLTAVTVNGMGGNDEIRNRTSVPMTALGGTGDDKIIGGFGDDVLYGEEGNDEIYGDFGNDTLHGGAHNDKLLGEGHDDVLYGGSGADYLYGGNDNDNLYGGTGGDRLYGEAGNDGLFGGDDFDRLYAGTGRDRLLRDERDSDLYYNTSSDDAIIYFKNGVSGSYTYDDLTLQYSNGYWNDAAIEAVDAALERLHDAAGSTKLLKTHSGGNMVLHRLGNWLGASDGSTQGETYGGWNPRNGNIFLTNVGMSGDVISLEQTVIHEFGHNWDWEGVNSTIGSFQAISGWTTSTITVIGTGRPGASWVVINASGGNTDDNWFYNPWAEGFVSEYGATDPYEDFAESFVAFVMGEDYVGYLADDSLSNGIEDTPYKKKYMEDFIKSKS
jgi:hypothetical protein